MPTYLRKMGKGCGTKITRCVAHTWSEQQLNDTDPSPSSTKDYSCLHHHFNKWLYNMRHNTGRREWERIVGTAIKSAVNDCPSLNEQVFTVAGVFSSALFFSSCAQRRRCVTQCDRVAEERFRVTADDKRDKNPMPPGNQKGYIK